MELLKTSSEKEHSIFNRYDVELRVKEIRKILARDGILEAVKQMIEIAEVILEDEQLANELIVISASIERLESFSRRGTIDFPEYDKKRNKLLYNILEVGGQISNRLK